MIDKLKTYDNLTEETRFNGVGEISYKFLKNFAIKSRTSTELLTARFFQSEYPDSFNALLFSSTVGTPTYQGGNFNGFEDINQRREFIFNQLWQLSYGKSFGKHTFNVSANAEYNNSTLNTNNFRKNGLDPKFFVPNSGGSGYPADTTTHDFYAPTVSASRLRNDLISYFGSMDYDFKNKYGLVASYRVDGTSRFLDENQFDSFWSVGARWNIDEEAFMDSFKSIDVLKLRGSIGTVGNQRIVNGTIYAGVNPPAFADIYSNSTAAGSYNNGSAFNINFGYPDLRWETTEQYNIGIDLEMFKSRLRANFDYYNKKTVDLYIDDPVVPGVGDFDDTITKNTDASVTNSGIELNIAYDIIRTANTTFTLRGNGSYNKNRVDGIRVNDGRIFDTGANTVTQNGGMIDEFYVYPYVGVNPDNGELLFEDINGNVTENPVDADLRATGKNRLPVYQGGFGFDFDYKGFFTSATFTFAQKVWRFDFDEENLYDPDNIGQFNVTSDLSNAWTTPGQVTDVPSMTAGNVGDDDLSDRFLRDASYIRLRNAQIGYKFSKKTLEKTFLTEASITLQGENLFNFTKWNGFDPESDRDFDVYQYPTPRLFSLGLDLKF